ncbi:MAG: hypothetical protein PUE18_07335 [Firmicutes bacterium]|nr:hypothetical protein [Bacillota bacterium]
MKKVLRKWLVATMAVALVLASSIGVLAAGGSSKPTLVDTKNVTVTSSYDKFKLDPDDTKSDRQTTTGLLKIYSDGSMKLTFKYPGTSFLKMYMGTALDAARADASEIIEARALTEGGYEYTVPLEKMYSAVNAAVLSSKGSWKDNTLTVKLVDDSKEVTVTSSYDKFKLDPDETKSDRQTTTGTVKFDSNGNMKLTFKYPGTSFLKMYMGTATEAARADASEIIEARALTEGGYEYTVPLEDMYSSVNAAVLSSKGSWKDNTLTVRLSQSGGENNSGSNVNPPTSNPEGGNSNNPQPAETQVILPDGTYSVDVATGTNMFKVVDCKLVVDGDKVSALVTLSSNGYDYLYVGTKKEAAAASQSTWSKWIKEIPAEGNTQRMYKIEMTKDALGNGLAMAAHSTKNNNWYDRNLTFDLSSLKIYSIGNNVDDAINNVVTDKTPSDNNSAGNTNNSNNTLTQNQIKDKLQSVDSSSVVKDGTYTPSFGFEGGSGRATIACNKVVVKNGKATATIVFSSPNFTWVKTGGKTYYNENKGGNSTFTIPVTLNGKTAISAETTAMSQPHVVDYTLYCFIDGTKVTTKNNTSTDTIELGTEADNTTADKDDANSWGEFDSETDATKAYESKIKGLTTGLVVVGGYAVAGTAFAAVRFRKLRKK